MPQGDSTKMRRSRDRFQRQLILLSLKYQGARLHKEIHRSTTFIRTICSPRTNSCGICLEHSHIPSPIGTSSTAGTGDILAAVPLSTGVPINEFGYN